MRRFFVVLFVSMSGFSAAFAVPFDISDAPVGLARPTQNPQSTDDPLPVCDRSDGMRWALYLSTGLPCEQISIDSLSSVTELIVRTPISETSDWVGLTQLSQVTLIGDQALIEPNAFTSAATVRQLVIVSNSNGFQAERLELSDIPSHPHVETLEIRDCVDGTLTRSFLDGFPNLKKLRVERACELRIAVGAFGGTSIEHLELEHEKTSIPTDDIQFFDRLRVFRAPVWNQDDLKRLVSNNPDLEDLLVVSGVNASGTITLMGPLGQGIFFQSPNLVSLEIRDCRAYGATCFQEGLLRFFPDLEVFKITGPLYGLSDDAFLENPKLRVVELEHRSQEGQLVTLPTFLFHSNSHLEEVTLSGFIVGYLGSNSLGGSRSLTMVDLIGLEIDGIDPAVFVNQPELKEVYLSNNELEELPLAFLNDCPKVETLNLRGNELSSVPEDLFAHSRRFERIILSDNPIDTLPDSVLRDWVRSPNLTLVGFDFQSGEEEERVRRRLGSYFRRYGLDR